MIVMNAWSPIPRPLAPQEIEIQLGQLICECLHRRSTDLAASVVQHVEALCAHPDYRGSWEERCAYRRLARHWSGLAWVFANLSARKLEPTLIPISNGAKP